ncbi:hypothetical protein CARUB_v10002247mg [Capsella rubella]|uniref:Uncharacterized protein n=1 Tax=Capsella rubella TaxID=81985 RepID=R0FIB7_9BRAS|nr:hypothetical protein CARUB_v10002247mg [Capsella rubella]
MASFKINFQSYENYLQSRWESYFPTLLVRQNSRPFRVDFFYAREDSWRFPVSIKISNPISKTAMEFRTRFHNFEPDFQNRHGILNPITKFRTRFPKPPWNFESDFQNCANGVLGFYLGGLIKRTDEIRPSRA